MIKIIIATDNEAFEGSNGTYEVARILGIISKDFSEGRQKMKYNDINGNEVAYVTIS